MKSRFLTGAAFLIFAACSWAQIPLPGVTALTGVRVIDGTGRPPIEQATILIENGRITAVGPAASVKIPTGATRQDMPGYTVMPGIINAHGHLGAKSDKPAQERLTDQLRVYADYGVTTVVVLGTGDNDLEDTLKLRDEQDHTTLERARVYAAGPSLRYIKTEEDARTRVDRYADAKVDLIKLHILGVPNDTQPPVYRAIIDEAHKRGLRVAAHMWYIKDARGLLDAQVDVLAHSIRDQDVDAPLIAEIKRRDVGYIPTLTRDLAVFAYDKTPDFFTDPFFLRHKDAYADQMAEINDPAHQEKVRTGKEAPMTRKALEQGSRNLKTLSDAGVSIASEPTAATISANGRAISSTSKWR